MFSYLLLNQTKTLPHSTDISVKAGALQLSTHTTKTIPYTQAVGPDSLSPSVTILPGQGKANSFSFSVQLEIYIFLPFLRSHRSEKDYCAGLQKSLSSFPVIDLLFLPIAQSSKGNIYSYIYVCIHTFYKIGDHKHILACGGG